LPTPKSPKAGDYSNEFIESKFHFRGTEYVLREVSVDVYDDLVEMATSKNDVGDEMIDNGFLRKQLALKTLVSPRFSDFIGKPLRLSNRIMNESWILNLGQEPDDEEKEPDIQDGEPEDKGEG